MLATGDYFGEIVKTSFTYKHRIREIEVQKVRLRNCEELYRCTIDNFLRVEIFKNENGTWLDMKFGKTDIAKAVGVFIETMAI